MRLSLLAGLVLVAATAAADTYIVRPDGTGDFPTIQAAIDAVVDGDVVELSPGTFTGDGNRDIDFLGKAITVTSQDGDPESCVIDCERQGRGFLMITSEDEASILRGITITQGLANVGGAVRCSSSAPGFENCVFLDNAGQGYGGAAYCERSAPSFESCVFLINEARNGSGGGMFCDYWSDPVVLGCSFEGNVAGSQGGAVACWGGSDATFEDCVFVGNTGPYGGAAYARDGSCPSFLRCRFVGNDAYEGGGIFGYTAYRLTDCTLIENSADHGGGIYSSGGAASIRGCTLYGNVAEAAAGIWSASEDATITNTIVAFNVLGRGVSGWARLSCCDLYGNEGGDWVAYIADQYGEDGNICEHPLFCGPEVGDFTLAENSPCAPFTPPNPECDLIGAWPVGCGPASVPDDPDLPGTAITWGHLKSIFQPRRR